MSARGNGDDLNDDMTEEISSPSRAPIHQEPPLGGLATEIDSIPPGTAVPLASEQHSVPWTPTSAHPVVTAPDLANDSSPSSLDATGTTPLQAAFVSSASGTAFGGPVRVMGGGLLPSSLQPHMRLTLDYQQQLQQHGEASAQFSTVDQGGEATIAPPNPPDCSACRGKHCAHTCGRAPLKPPGTRGAKLAFHTWSEGAAKALESVATLLKIERLVEQAAELGEVAGLAEPVAKLHTKLEAGRAWREWLEGRRSEPHRLSLEDAESLLSKAESEGVSMPESEALKAEVARAKEWQEQARAILVRSRSDGAARPGFDELRALLVEGDELPLRVAEAAMIALVRDAEQKAEADSEAWFAEQQRKAEAARLRVRVSAYNAYAFIYETEAPPEDDGEDEMQSAEDETEPDSEETQPESQAVNMPWDLLPNAAEEPSPRPAAASVAPAYDEPMPAVTVAHLHEMDFEPDAIDRALERCGGDPERALEQLLPSSDDAHTSASYSAEGGLSGGIHRAGSAADSEEF